MKKQLLFLVALLATLQSYGQTDELNLQKYWKFRNNFVQKFVKIGDQPGESFPIGVRAPSTYCYDNTNGSHAGAMLWGDGGVRHGHYLTLLATEYALRKKYNQETEGVLNELYFALYALNRVDDRAEADLDYNYGINGYYTTPTRNGFYLREDIPEDFTLNWQTDALDPKCAYSPNYTNNNVQKLNNGSNFITTPESSYQNTPSIDQMISILYGIRMVYDLVDNIEVTPPGETPMFVVSEAVAIADRMIKYVADRNWMIIDVHGWPVNSNGGDLALAGYPLVRIWEHLHGGSGFPYNTFFIRRTRDYLDPQHCLTGFGVNEQTAAAQGLACDECVSGLKFQTMNQLQNYSAQNPGIYNNQNYSGFKQWMGDGSFVSNVMNENGVWSNTLPNTLHDDFNLLTNRPFIQQNWDLNAKLAMYSGVTADIWPPVKVRAFGDETENYELELGAALFSGELPNRSQQYYRNLLNSMPSAGSFSLNQLYPLPNESDMIAVHQTGGWAAAYKWISDSDFGNQTGPRKGIYSGMDYMVLHNLYYLVYEDQMPEYSEDFQCFCESTTQVQPVSSNPDHVLQADFLNDKLNLVPFCEKHVFVDDIVTSSESPFVINPYFDDYVDLKISTAKFCMENTTIANGALVEVNSHLIVCNGTTLTGISGSTLDINKADIRINDQATVDASGDIIVRDGNKLWVKEGAKLILRGGSELRIKEGGQLIIDGTLEYYDGASIITEYDNAEIVLNGTIKMMDGGVFTCGNTPGQPTGRLVINSSNAKFSKAIGAGFCEVKLAGQDENDEFVVIKKDVALKVMHLMPTNINRLFVHSSKVVFEENAFMDVRQEFITSNASYVSNKMNRGIRVTNFNKFASVDLENVNIHADLNAVFGEKLSMINCTMTNTPGITDPTEPMVDVQGTGFGVNYCIFEGDNEAYIYAENLTFPSAVTNSTFNGLAETSATAIEDRSNTELTVSENTFNNMYNGVWKLYDPVKVRCNTFNNSTRNDVGAVLGSTANLSSDDFGGYNDFNSEDASYGHIWLWEGDVELNNGGNYFNPAIQKHIYARMPYPCPYGLYCYIAANRNQWNTGTQVPSASKFDVVGSDLSPIDVDASSPSMQPTCGSWDTSPPVGSGILPNVSTSLGDLPLDKAIFFARSEMTHNDTLANDEDALKLFDEIFSANVSLDSANTRRLMYNALSDMKTSLEAEYYTQVVLQESGQNPVMDYVDQYLSALNYMTPSSITADNYRQAFHLELDKAQLFRMLEMPEAALEILEFTEACGLDSLEQEALNYWKEQVELDIVIDSMGLDFLDSNIIIDTKGYNPPTSNPAAIYHFGTHFNTLYDRTYTSCSGEERLMGGQEDQELINLGVYPVPADEVINITIEVEDGIVLSSIQLFDAMGRKMGEIELQPNQTEVRNYSIRNWASGVYYYNVSGPSGSFGGGTFIVE